MVSRFTIRPMPWRIRVLLLIVRCSRAIPPSFAWWLGGVLGYAYGSFTARDKGRANKHLQRAFPEQSASWCRQRARLCFRHVARMALWTIATIRKPPSWHRRLAAHQSERLQATYQASLAGEGTVVVAAHAGNWEQLARAVSCYLPTALLGKRMRSAYVDILVRWMRCRTGGSVLYQDDSIMSCIKALRRGEILATLPDQDISRLAGCFVPWFGHPAYTPLGPAMLAVLSRCPVQAVICLWEGDRWVAHWGPRRYAKDYSGDSRDEQAAALTAAYTADIEHIIRRHPDQWVWWHRRWRTQLADKPDAVVVS